MKAFPVFFCALLLLATGCATRPPLTEETLQTIIPIVSTRATVEELLGKPDGAITGANRNSLTIYQDRSVDVKFGLLKDEFDLIFLTAHFLFDPQGVLEKKLVSETRTTSVTQWGIRTVGTPVTDEQLAGILPNQSTFPDVERILGPPISEGLTLDGFIVREWAFLRSTVFSTTTQLLIILFDYENQLVQDFWIKDDVPPKKTKKAESN